VARGLDTAAIAERLVISPWTVQDHLKAVFAKTATRSRRELLSQVFFHDQLPGIVAHDPVNAGGYLREPRQVSSKPLDSQGHGGLGQTNDPGA
jgi:Bacterial regulatory proteins, luxR family